VIEGRSARSRSRSSQCGGGIALVLIIPTVEAIGCATGTPTPAGVKGALRRRAVGNRTRCWDCGGVNDKGD